MKAVDRQRTVPVEVIDGRIEGFGALWAARDAAEEGTPRRAAGWDWPGKGLRPGGAPFFGASGGVVGDAWEGTRGGTLQATLGYDAAGRRKLLTLGNGAVVRYEYTPDSQLERVRTVGSGGKVIAAYSYEYNDRGERTKVVREHLGESMEYGYDEAGRLTSEESTGNVGDALVYANQFATLPGGNESADGGEVSAVPLGSPFPLTIPGRQLSWGYDRAGNRLWQDGDGVRTEYHHDAESRLTSEEAPGVSVSHQYDENGNEKVRTTTRGADVTVETMGYDYANRVVSYTKVMNGTQTGGGVYAFTASGERLSKHDVAADTTEWYTYDGSDVVADYLQEGAGALAHEASYVGALSIDSKIARIGPDGAGSYYVTDALGSVAHVIGSDQALVSSEATDAWGNVVASSGQGDRYGFTGREKDAESGLMHYRARSYDPRLGRFLSRDPAGSGGRMSPYVYGGDNPASFGDPSGMYNEDVHFYTTLYLAAVGKVDNARAFNIAGSDQWVDEFSVTEPAQMTLRRNWLATHPDDLLAVVGKVKTPTPTSADQKIFRMWYFYRKIESRSEDPLPKDIQAAAREMSWRTFPATTSFLPWFIHFPAQTAETPVAANSSYANRISDMAAAPDYDTGGDVTWGPIKRDYLFGIGMHTLQDSFCHDGFSGRLGHLDKGPAIENVFYRKNAAIGAAKNVYERAARYAGTPAKFPEEAEATLGQLLNFRNAKSRIDQLKDLIRARFIANGDKIPEGLLVEGTWNVVEAEAGAAVGRVSNSREELLR